MVLGWFESLQDWLQGNNRGGRFEFVAPFTEVHRVLGQGPEELYRTQPHLRTVVTFLARNIAQLPVHVFDRVSDTDRRRVTDGFVAELFRRPNTAQTWFELMFSTVVELKLYDSALWTVVETGTGWDVRLIPSSWVVSTGGGDRWAPGWVRVAYPGGRLIELDSSQVLGFHGYRPGEPAGGVSPVDALRDVLAEQIQAWTYRQQVWQRGGRVGTFITRPAGVPWSDEARSKFQRDWSARWAGGNGSKVGGTPILEDGMTLGSQRFNAREEEWAEVAKLSLATVASVYHTSPTMVGILDNANYSNVREFARMLYTDTLGPDLAMFEQRINGFLLPRIGAPKGVYAEFALQAKLAGSFEEQASVMSASVGAPWMSRNEARARLNLPRLDGGDELVTPLNVLIGGQASPLDSGSQNVRHGSGVGVKALPSPTSAPVRFKAAGREKDAKGIEKVLAKFFKRQGAAVLSRLGAKSPDYWDGERWNKELGEELFKIAVKVSGELGPEVLEELGLSPNLYDVDRTVNFLKAVAGKRAEMLNAITLKQLEAALAGELSDDAVKSTPAGVFEEAETVRAVAAAATFATVLSGFTHVEAVEQSGRSDEATKTWVTVSESPRPSHLAMEGETVGVDEVFSNGMKWPGDYHGARGKASEIANCSCMIDLEVL